MDLKKNLIKKKKSHTPDKKYGKKINSNCFADNC